MKKGGSLLPPFFLSNTLKSGIDNNGIVIIIINNFKIHIDMKGGGPKN
jgi:hypothetical protein